ncbi:GerW family sporulation protein [Barrientosiimonas marina]|uniref:GerW family sporulation protein n=1 Tax=Lentibacillus kimchii TaxID=1542911 RepID=A0ABW2UWM7_9BACI
MNDDHPIQGLMTTAMENLQDMIDVNTIIGDPVESPDGSMIIPVSKLGFGFAAGGSEFTGGQQSSDSSSSDSYPFGGGSGGGVSVTPIAFLIINSKGVKMIHLDESTHIYEKMMDFAPKAVEKIQQLLKESGLPEMMKQQTKQSGNQENQNSRQEKKRRSKQDQDDESDDEDESD